VNCPAAYVCSLIFYMSYFIIKIVVAGIAVIYTI
jgi:hypothetical protein